MAKKKDERFITEVELAVARRQSVDRWQRQDLQKRKDEKHRNFHNRNQSSELRFEKSEDPNELINREGNNEPSARERVNSEGSMFDEVDSDVSEEKPAPPKPLKPRKKNEDKNSAEPVSHASGSDEASYFERMPKAIVIKAEQWQPEPGQAHTVTEYIKTIQQLAEKADQAKQDYLANPGDEDKKAKFNRAVKELTDLSKKYVHADGCSDRHNRNILAALSHDGRSVDLAASKTGDISKNLFEQVETYEWFEDEKHHPLTDFYKPTMQKDRVTEFIELAKNPYQKVELKVRGGRPEVANRHERLSGERGLSAQTQHHEARPH